MVSEGTVKWFDVAPTAGSTSAPDVEPSDDNAVPGDKLLGHSYMDMSPADSHRAELGATAFDALMIRSAIESA